MSPWVIQILDDFGSGAALVAELSHCLRDKQIGRQPIFGKHSWSGSRDGVNQPGDFCIPVRPHFAHDVAGQHDGPPLRG